ncbi:hypothetical protein JXO52_13140 [bacterium]|nr:hypothetical protein [bacterium]
MKAKNYVIVIAVVFLAMAVSVSAQQYFHPVNNTGETGAVVIQNALIDGGQLTPGDEIGIFDGDLCVGAAVYEGGFPLGCSAILEYVTPSGTVLPGAKPGHQMRFKLWSHSAGSAGDAEAGLESGGYFGDILTVVSTLQALLTSVSPAGGTPAAFQLEQNYPNPFNPETVIGYTLDRAGNTRMDIYTITGSKVKTLVDRHQGPGSYRIVWDGTDDRGLKAASGSYLLMLRSGGRSEMRKMLLMR